MRSSSAIAALATSELPFEDRLAPAPSRSCEPTDLDRAARLGSVDGFILAPAAVAADRHCFVDVVVGAVHVVPLLLHGETQRHRGIQLVPTRSGVAAVGAW